MTMPDLKLTEWLHRWTTNLKQFLGRNGTARFALFQLEPTGGSSEKVNNIEINIIITHAD
jgi:hypothetical protein